MKQPIKHFILPDVQAKPGVPLDHLRWAGRYVAEKRPDVIVCLGDFTDMESLSPYDEGKKSHENKRYVKDLEAAHRGMELFCGPIRKARRYSPRLILTLGNHENRIPRTVETNARLEGRLDIGDLRYGDYGWKVYPFLQPVEVNGVHYSHYFPSGVMGRPCTSARKLINTYHVSCVAGHQQGRDVAYAKRGDGRSITSIICGSFYQHDEAYLNPISNNCWRGVMMLHEVQDGSFDEMFISLDYLRRKYA